MSGKERWGRIRKWPQVRNRTQSPLFSSAAPWQGHEYHQYVCRNAMAVKLYVNQTIQKWQRIILSKKWIWSNQLLQMSWQSMNMCVLHACVWIPWGWAPCRAVWGGGRWTPGGPACGHSAPCSAPLHCAPAPSGSKQSERADTMSLCCRGASLQHTCQPNRFSEEMYFPLSSRLIFWKRWPRPNVIMLLGGKLAVLTFIFWNRTHAVNCTVHLSF